jgi:hypothetical protein
MCAMDAGTDLALSLDAFYTEHRKCGELDGGLKEDSHELPFVWMSSSCGATISRET